MRIIAAVLVVSLVACAGESKELPHGTRADRVVVDKSERRLSLYRGRQLLKTYRVALGGNPIGDKVQQGDERTPEGRYSINYRNARSSYHRSLHISYPSSEDRREAALRGVDAGGDIMIHGLPNGLGALGAAHVKSDWTLGCIAVTNEEIEEIWRVVPDGTPIVIGP